MTAENILKSDIFGEVRYEIAQDDGIIVRDVARSAPWLRWLAKRLMRREAAALAQLDGLAGVPALISLQETRLERQYIAGKPMQDARPGDRQFYTECAKLLRCLHRHGVVHNDLAKEPNVLVTDDGSPAFIDYQLAWVSRRRSRLFRTLAYEDIRHLLKHKRSYCSHALTARERAILAKPAWPSRFWMAAVKPVYLFVTRRLFGWADREGAADRGRTY